MFEGKLHFSHFSMLLRVFFSLRAKSQLINNPRLKSWGRIHMSHHHITAFWLILTHNRKRLIWDVPFRTVQTWMKDSQLKRKMSATFIKKVFSSFIWFVCMQLFIPFFCPFHGATPFWVEWMCLSSSADQVDRCSAADVSAVWCGRGDEGL